MIQHHMVLMSKKEPAHLQRPTIVGAHMHKTLLRIIFSIVIGWLLGAL